MNCDISASCWLPEMVALARSTETCNSCGTRLESTSGGSDFGCIACWLRLGFDEQESLTPGAADDVIPHQLGPFVIVRDEQGMPCELGRGGMGVTYRATDASLHRSVALKMISPELAGPDSEGRERFMREARAAAALRHPNVATIYQFGIREETGQCFFAMELVEGETLEERVRRAGPLPVPTVLDIALQVADALVAAEKHRLVHRDLKPANIMVVDGETGGEPNVKVIDFGVAKALTENTDAMCLTHHGFIGTPAFASPEQFASRPVDVRSDIYSLGATLWFLLTGEIPFRGKTIDAIRAEQQEAKLPLAQLTRVGVPRKLVTLIASMLALSPALRPDLGTVKRRLLECRREVIKRQPRPLQLALFAAAAAAVSGGIALWFLSHHPAAALPEKSLAVLPFADRGDEKENAYFASGIHDDLLVNLAKVADLKVISRDSVLPYQAGSRNLREIGKALQVKAIVEGNVRRMGNRARINLQLIETATGRQLWAQNYDREMTDAFAIQSDLAMQIASALKAKLTASETAHLQRPPTQNGEAYLLCIQANDFFAGYEKRRPDLEKAEQLYERAIQLDPAFALALAQLSHVETLFNSFYEFVPERRAKARALAERALQLQPDLPEAHMALGYDYFQGASQIGEYQFEKAAAEFELALKTLPNSAEIYGALARIRRDQGKWSDALASFRKAAALDPNNPERWHRLFYTCQLVRNYPEAAKALDRAIALDPNSWQFEYHRAFLNLFWKGDLSGFERLRTPTGNSADERHTSDRFWAKMILRRYDEAEKILLADPREDFGHGDFKALLLGELYFRRNDTARARAGFEAARPTMERAIQEKPLDAEGYSNLATVYAGLGREEDAVREAERALSLDSQNAVSRSQREIDLAELYAKFGDADRALPILRHLLSVPSNVHVHALRLDPVWDPLRSDPQFKQLLREYETKQGTGIATAWKHGS